MFAVEARELLVRCRRLRTHNNSRLAHRFFSHTSKQCVFFRSSLCFLRIFRRFLLLLGAMNLTTRRPLRPKFLTKSSDLEVLRILSLEKCVFFTPVAWLLAFILSLSPRLCYTGHREWMKTISYRSCSHTFMARARAHTHRESPRVNTSKRPRQKSDNFTQFGIQLS